MCSVRIILRTSFGKQYVNLKILPYLYIILLSWMLTILTQTVATLFTKAIHLHTQY